MVAPIGTELGLGQIGLGLMQPVKRAVHPPMMPFSTGFTTGFGRGGQQVAWLWEHQLPLEDAWLALQDHHDLWSNRQQLDLSGLHRLEWLPT